jgi:hypothetical protein
MNGDFRKKGTAWVTTYDRAEDEQVGTAIKALSGRKELTFNVAIRGYSSHFYLLDDSTKFIIAKELGLDIMLLQYDEEDFIDIDEVNFAPKDVYEHLAKNGRIRVGDLFENFSWDGDMHKVRVDLILANT